MMQRVVHILIAKKGMGNWLMMQKSYKYRLSRIVLQYHPWLPTNQSFMIRTKLSNSPLLQAFYFSCAQDHLRSLFFKCQKFSIIQCAPNGTLVGITLARFRFNLIYLLTYYYANNKIYHKITSVEKIYIKIC